MPTYIIEVDIDIEEDVSESSENAIRLWMGVQAEKLIRMLIKDDLVSDGKFSIYKQEYLGGGKVEY